MLFPRKTRIRSHSMILLQLFRERLSEQNVHATISKGNMLGYDQYTVPDTVAVELSFVAFL